MEGNNKTTEQKELKVQHLLRSNPLSGITQLKTEFNLNVRKHKTYPNLISLHYNQVKADFSKSIVRECRGIVLDEDDNYKAVACPYFKFFNYKEELAAQLNPLGDEDRAKLLAYEKLDGTLATLYWYKEAWHVATSSHADAAGPVMGSEGTITYADLFWRTWKKSGYILPKEKDKCYMFELMSLSTILMFPQQIVPSPSLRSLTGVTHPHRPENKCTVASDTDKVVLHGVRSMQTLEEEDPEPTALKYRWDTAPLQAFSMLEEVVEAAKELNPAESEGFVVRDGKFNRVKVKSPQFVALSLLSGRDKSTSNQRRMIEIVRTNEQSEFLSYFPQWEPLYHTTKEAYMSFCERIRTTTNQLAEQFSVECIKEGEDCETACKRHFALRLKEQMKKDKHKGVTQKITKGDAEKRESPTSGVLALPPDHYALKWWKRKLHKVPFAPIVLLVFSGVFKDVREALARSHLGSEQIEKMMAACGLLEEPNKVHHLPGGKVKRVDSGGRGTKKNKKRGRHQKRGKGRERR